MKYVRLLPLSFLLLVLVACGSGAPAQSAATTAMTRLSACCISSHNTRRRARSVVQQAGGCKPLLKGDPLRSPLLLSKNSGWHMYGRN